MEIYIQMNRRDKVFEPQPSATKNESEDELLYFSRNQGKGGKAIGKITEEGFWVLKGSYICPGEAAYLYPGLIQKRKDHAKDIDDNGILQKDICFGSPSYAAAFVCGKNSNGLVEWKDRKGRPLKELNGDLDPSEKMIQNKKNTTKNEPKKQKVEKIAKGHDHSIKSRVDDNVLVLSAKGIVAYAEMVTDGILVKKGSQFHDSETNSCAESIKNRRKKLIQDGDVKNNEFTRDVLFGSPSTAAACILGMSVNGRTAWRNKEGKTLKEMGK